MTIVPYKGTAPLMTDLVGGHVPVAFGVLPPALGNIAAGQLRVLAVTSATRFNLLPDVPTADESGLPGFEAVLHYGLLAPAGTPRPIIDRLNKELRDITNLEDGSAVFMPRAAIPSRVPWTNTPQTSSVK
jgi:tripartite-type tricarboxylate transporter receptor subunit TctC